MMYVIAHHTLFLSECTNRARLRYDKSMIRKMILTRGYPGFGKSTWADSYMRNAPHRTVRIERDEIRTSLGVTGKTTNSKTELAVSNVAQLLLDNAVRFKADVLISDTNLVLKYVKQYIRWADDHGYEVEIIDFIEPLDVLEDRDMARPKAKRVGLDALRNLAKKYPVSRWLSVEEIRREMAKQQKESLREGERPAFRNDPSLPEAILVDIDGTLAHMVDRDPFEFHLVGQDSLDEQVASTVAMYARSGVSIIVMSGRPETCRTETEEWLARYKVPYSELWMRGADDYRPDWKVKDELVRAHVENRYHILFCLDDRNQVVDHYRACGYKVYQVEPGNF